MCILVVALIDVCCTLTSEVVGLMFLVTTKAGRRLEPTNIEKGGWLKQVQMLKWVFVQISMLKLSFSKKRV